ncbi:MAG: hypothetical protein ACFE9C_17125, partial [Candidatus Hodarchaeota archaeon]
SVNGTPRTGTTDLTYRAGGGYWKSFAAFFEITGVATQQTVSIDFRANGGTDVIDKARIIAFMIPDPANADIQSDEDLDLTLDNVNPTNALTTTFTPTSSGDYIWLANGFNHEGPGGGSNGGLYAVDETSTEQQNTDESYIPQGDGFIPFFHVEERPSLAASSQTFTIRHDPDTTSGSERQGLTQMLFRSDVFELVEIVSSTTTNTTTNTTWTNKSPVLTLTTASPVANRDYIYLVVMGLAEQVNDLTYSTLGQVRLDSIEQIQDQVAIARSYYDRQITWVFAENGAGGRTINGRYMTDNALQTARARNAHALSLRYTEATGSLGTEETSSGGSVDITVYVHHTATDGSDPQLITSASTTIDSDTANPLAFDVGNDPVGQTFTSADPRVLRLQVQVTAVNDGGSFTLAYDTSTDPSSLDTPIIVVPEGVLPFVAIAVLIPLVMAGPRRKEWMKSLSERFRIIRRRCGQNLARSKGYVRQRTVQSARDELASE